MDLNDLKQYGPIVTVVALFLGYLIRKDNFNRETAKEGHAAASALAKEIGHLKGGVGELRSGITELRNDLRHEWDAKRDRGR